MTALPGLPTDDEERHFTPELAALYRSYAAIFLQRGDPLTAAAALERALCVYTFAFAKASAALDRRYASVAGASSSATPAAALSSLLSGGSAGVGGGAHSPTDASLMGGMSPAAASLANLTGLSTALGGGGDGGRGGKGSAGGGSNGGLLGSAASMRMLASFRKPSGAATTMVENGTQSFLYSMLMLLVEKTYRDIAHCYCAARLEGMAEPFVDRSAALLLVANGGRRDTPARSAALVEAANMKMRLAEMEKRRRELIRSNADEIDDRDIKNDRALREMVTAEVNERAYALAGRAAAEEALRALALADELLTGDVRAALHQWAAVGLIYAQEDARALEAATLARDEVVQCSRVSTNAATATALGGGPAAAEAALLGTAGGESSASVSAAAGWLLPAAPAARPPTLIERMQEVKWVKSQRHFFFEALRRRDYATANELLDRSILFAFYGLNPSAPHVTIICESSSSPSSTSNGVVGRRAPTVTDEAARAEMPPPAPHENLGLRTNFTPIELAAHYGGDWRRQPTKYLLPLHEVLLHMDDGGSNSGVGGSGGAADLSGGTTVAADGSIGGNHHDGGASSASAASSAAAPPLPPSEAGKKAALHMLARLIAAGTSVNTASPHDLKTPLHIAVDRGMAVPAMLLLAEGGADPSFAPPLTLTSTRTGLSTSAKIAALPSTARIQPPIEHCRHNDALLLLLATHSKRPQRVFRRHMRSIVERCAAASGAAQRRRLLTRLFGSDAPVVPSPHMTEADMDVRRGVGITPRGAGENYYSGGDDEVEEEEDGLPSVDADGGPIGLFRHLLIDLIGGGAAKSNNNTAAADAEGENNDDEDAEEEKANDDDPLLAEDDDDEEGKSSHRHHNHRHRIGRGLLTTTNIVDSKNKKQNNKKSGVSTAASSLPPLSSEAREELAAICPPHLIGDALMRCCDDPFVAARLCYKLVSLEDPRDGSMDPFRVVGFGGVGGHAVGVGGGGYDGGVGEGADDDEDAAAVRLAALQQREAAGGGTSAYRHHHSGPPPLGGGANSGAEGGTTGGGVPTSGGGVLNEIIISTNYLRLFAERGRRRRSTTMGSGGSSSLNTADGHQQHPLFSNASSPRDALGASGFSNSFQSQYQHSPHAQSQSQQQQKVYVDAVLLQFLCLCIQRGAMATVEELTARFPHRLAIDSLHWEYATLYRRKMREYLAAKQIRAMRAGGKGKSGGLSGGLAPIEFVGMERAGDTNGAPEASESAAE